VILKKIDKRTMIEEKVVDATMFLHLKHRVMNYIEAPIALPLSLDNEAMMPPRRKMLISPLFDKFDRTCNSFPPHSAPLLLTVLFLFLIEIPIAVDSHLS